MANSLSWDTAARSVAAVNGILATATGIAAFTNSSLLPITVELLAFGFCAFLVAAFYTAYAQVWETMITDDDKRWKGSVKQEEALWREEIELANALITAREEYWGAATAFAKERHAAGGSCPVGPSASTRRQHLFFETRTSRVCAHRYRQALNAYMYSVQDALHRAFHTTVNMRVVHDGNTRQVGLDCQRQGQLLAFLSYFRQVMNPLNKEIDNIDGRVPTDTQQTVATTSPSAPRPSQAILKVLPPVPEMGAGATLLDNTYSGSQKLPTGCAPSLSGLHEQRLLKYMEASATPHTLPEFTVAGGTTGRFRRVLHFQLSSYQSIHYMAESQADGIPVFPLGARKYLARLRLDNKRQDRRLWCGRRLKSVRQREDPKWQSACCGVRTFLLAISTIATLSGIAMIVAVVLVELARPSVTLDTQIPSIVIPLLLVIAAVFLSVVWCSTRNLTHPVDDEHCVSFSMQPDVTAIEKSIHFALLDLAPAFSVLPQILLTLPTSGSVSTPPRKAPPLMFQAAGRPTMNVDVIQQALAVLCGFALHGHNISKLAGLHTISGVTAVLRQTQAVGTSNEASTAVVKWACRALSILIEDGASKQQVLQAVPVPTLVLLLSSHFPDADLVTDLSSTLWSLAEDSAPHSPIDLAVASGGAIPAIVAALSKHFADEFAGYHLCGALGSMVADEFDAVAALQAGGLESIMMALTVCGRGGQPRYATAASYALHRLAAAGLQQLEAFTRGVSHVVATLCTVIRAHAADSGVSNYGCSALALLAHGPSGAQRLMQDDTYRVVFMAMNNCPNNASVAAASCGAIASLISAVHANSVGPSIPDCKTVERFVSDAIANILLALERQTGSLLGMDVEVVKRACTALTKLVRNVDDAVIAAPAVAHVLRAMTIDAEDVDFLIESCSFLESLVAVGGMSASAQPATISSAVVAVLTKHHLKQSIAWAACRALLVFADSGSEYRGHLIQQGSIPALFTTMNTVAAEFPERLRGRTAAIAREALGLLALEPAAWETVTGVVATGISSHDAFVACNSCKWLIQFGWRSSDRHAQRQVAGLGSVQVGAIVPVPVLARAAAVDIITTLVATASAYASTLSDKVAAAIDAIATIVHLVPLAHCSRALEPQVAGLIQCLNLRAVVKSAKKVRYGLRRMQDMQHAAMKALGTALNVVNAAGAAGLLGALPTKAAHALSALSDNELLPPTLSDIVRHSLGAGLTVQPGEQLVSQITEVTAIGAGIDRAIDAIWRVIHTARTTECAVELLESIATRGEPQGDAAIAGMVELLRCFPGCYLVVQLVLDGLCKLIGTSESVIERCWAVLNSGGIAAIDASCHPHLLTDAAINFDSVCSLLRTLHDVCDTHGRLEESACVTTIMSRLRQPEVPVPPSTIVLVTMQ